MKKLHLFLYNILFCCLFFCFTAVKSQIPSYVPTNGLVGWWPFNGNANDESGNGNHGIVNGATLTTDRFGNVNSSYFLETISSYISASINDSVTGKMTLSCWFKFPQPYSYSSLYLVANGPGYPNVTKYLAIDQNNARDGAGNYSFQFNPNTSQQNVSTVFTASPNYVNKWVHIVGTYDQSLVKIYIDGVLIQSLAYSGPTGSFKSIWNFSKWDNPSLPSNPQRYIDDIAIYNRALTQQEITNLYNATTNTTSCVANIINRDTSICQGQSVVLNGTSTSSVTDIDGNVYPTVNIGTQTWTQKNLNVSRYRNGDIIPQVTNSTQWSNLTTGAWCWYNNDSVNYAKYGKLYNWYAVNDSRGLAPEGWKVPSDGEWNQLIKFLDPQADTNCQNCTQSSIVGGLLKESGTSNWSFPNTGATNSTLFSAIASGTRQMIPRTTFNGEFIELGLHNRLWSSSDVRNGTALYRMFDYSNTIVRTYADPYNYGYTVRFLRNNFQNNQSSSLLWSTGATTPSITITPTQSTTYYLTATSGNTTCRDSVRVTVNTINQNFFQQDTIRTCGTSYAIAAGPSFNSYSWNTGDAAPSIIVRNSGWYRCTVRSGICTATDSVYIEFVRANIINRDTTVCLGSSVTLTAEPTGLPSNLRNGLVGYWPFNGNANDESGNGNHGTVNGATLTTDRFGNVGKAYGFDGNDLIKVLDDSTLRLTSNSSVSFWFKPINYANGQRLLDKSTGGTSLGWLIDYSPGPNYIGRIRTLFFNASASAMPYSNPVLTDNSWKNVTVTTATNNIKIYIDGSLDTSIILNDGITTSTFNNLIFGAPTDTTAAGYFTGKLDDIAIYNRALSPSEVTQLYQSTNSGNILWSTGATSPSITVTPNVSSTYYLNVTSGNTTCRDSVRVNITNFNANPIAQDTIITCNAAYTIIPAAGYTRYTWSNGTVTPNNTVRSSGWYKLTVLIGNCSATDSVYIKMLSANILNRDTTICQGQSVTLNAAQSGTGLASNLRNGLVGYWPFNGNANDESGNGNHGVVNNGTNGSLSYVTDRFGNNNAALNFSSDPSWNVLGPYIEIKNSSQLLVNSAFAIAYSVKVSSNNQIGEIINKGADNFSNIFFARVTDGKLQNYITSRAAFNLDSFPINSWQNVVVTRNSNSIISVYINGVLQDSASSLGIDNIQSNYFFGSMVSGSTNGSHYPFQGAMDDIGFWNRALSPSEVTQLYQSTGSGNLLWSNGATTPSITVTPSTSTTYFLTVSEGNVSCQDTVRVNVTPFVQNPILVDTVYACGRSTSITAQSGCLRYSWSNGAVTPSTTVNASGWYYLTAISSNCTAYDSVYVQFVNANILNNDTSICLGQSVTLNAAQSGTGLASNLRNGLVGYWPFNGNANDESGNGNHGVVNGATLTTDRFGNVGKAYGFDGVNDFIQCLYPGPIGNSSVSIGAWMKTNQSSTAMIAGYGSDSVFGFGNDFNLFINASLGSCSSGLTFDTHGAALSKSFNWNNSWHYVVVVYNANISDNAIDAKIYIDGILIQTSCVEWQGGPPAYNTNFSGQNPIRFAKYHGTVKPVGFDFSNPDFFNGSLDDIAIYNRALSPSEVTQLYQSTGSGNLLWSNGATTPSITVTPSTSTTYFLTVSEGNVSCQDTVRVNVTPFVQNPILADTVYACGRSTSISAQSGCLRYNWSNGAVTPSTTVTTSGWYYLTAISSNCTAYDSVYVQFVNANILNNDTSICLGQSVTLNAEQGGSSLPSNLRNGLVGYWPFNGNANDESGNGNHGVVNGATLTTDRFGNVGKAYGFDGVNDFIQCLYPGPIGNSSVSIGAWMKTNQSSTAMIAGYGSDSVFGFGNDFNLFINASLGSCSSGLTFDTHGAALSKSFNWNNSWHYVVVVYNANISDNAIDAKIYIDGILIQTSCVEWQGGPPAYNTNFSGQNPIRFAKYHGTVKPVGFDFSNPDFFNGSLDDIAIYNRALSPSEVTQLYQSTGSGSLLWSTGATTPSITVTPTANTTYYLTASQGNVSCRDSVRVNVTNISLGMPGTISGNTDACASIASDSAYRYTIRKVLGATSYQWTVPSGATLVSGQGDTTVLIKFGSSYVSGGQISVAARSQCNQLSPARTLSVTRPVLQTPVGIQQSFTPSVAAVYSVCGLNNAIYRIRKVTGATGYVWTLRRGFNASIVSLNGTGVNDTAIQINFQNGFVFDTISVRAISGCAQSAARTLVLNTNYTPAKIQAITTQGGNFVACIGQPMTLTAIPATPLSYQSALSRYSWTLPTGAFVVSASSSDSVTITINFNSNFRGGSVSVRGRSNCTTTYCGSTSAILKYYPPTPLSIVSGTGSYNACVGDQVTYTVLVPSPSSSQTQAVRFRWTLPLSTTIVSATADSSSVTVRFLNNFNGGRLSVRGITDCGTLGANYGQLLSHNGCAPGTKLPVTSRRSEQTKQSFTAKLYPNPTASDFRVQMEGMNSMPVVIKTMDVQGRLISSKQYQPATIISMETPKSAGTYWIEIRQGESVVVLKGVKVG